MRFEFATATRIVFGNGTWTEVPALASGLLTAGRPKHALVVDGRSETDSATPRDQLARDGFDVTRLEVTGEPSTDSVMAGVHVARDHGCNLVIGFGGGSAIDTGKAIAAMLTNEGELLDYLEVIGAGRKLTRPAAPCLAVPTTAGTGAEVTRNAVLASPEHRVKVSLRSPLMLPSIALVDPELTYDLPPAITASTGLDALTQLIEAFVSVRANPMTEAVCREGIPRAARSLRRAYDNGHDADAREDMAMASLFGGLALANAGLGAVHGFAGPVGGMFPAPHGAVCAALLPIVCAVNVRALRERSPNDVAVSKYDELARLLAGHPDAEIDESIGFLAELTRDLAIPSLGAYGVTDNDIRELVAKGAAASSMKGNPIKLADDELAEILSRSI